MNPAALNGRCCCITMAEAGWAEERRSTTVSNKDVTEERQGYQMLP